ncbi:hypothetical protein [Vibrio sp. SCSIO 43169]|uniref:hypothetical protein n=1 Tax=Vibrio sp. SCSIO 43169 TaxID=2822801 RepID=UPI0020445582|nr:hypothetical protein [Vibrio sp. SCSIO 43169]
MSLNRGVETDHKRPSYDAHPYQAMDIPFILSSSQHAHGGARQRHRAVAGSRGVLCLWSRGGHCSAYGPSRFGRWIGEIERAMGFQSDWPIAHDH